MSTKIYVATVLTLLVTLLFGNTGMNGAALASGHGPQADAPINEKNKLVGQIIAVDSESMILDTSLYGEVTIYFNGNTLDSFAPAGSEGPSDGPVYAPTSSIGKLAAGQWVVVYFIEIGGKLFAQSILLLDEVDPARVQFTGDIAAIDLENGTISLVTPDQETLTVYVDESVLFLGEISGLSDLQIGMTITVTGLQMADGTVLANSIALGAPLPGEFVPFHGTITAVDLDAGMFTVQDLNSGELLNFFVNEETLYFSEGEFIQSLADLQPGMEVKVRATLTEEGQYLAFQVRVLSTVAIPVPEGIH